MKDEIELRHLRYFLAVAETLHFGRAAKKLGMAQPPLSQQIRRLEEMLGAPLFERTTRGVTLTPAGVVLRERALSSMARLADDLEQTRRVAHGEEGRLTVGFSGSVMFTELPMAIQAYRRAYPRVEVRLREMWTSDQLAALADGSIDVGFLRDGERRPDLEITPLLREPFRLALPAEHRLKRQRIVDPKDTGASLHDRARAYLHANCSQCHVRSGGGNSNMQLASSFADKDMEILNAAPLHTTFGIPDAQLAAPGAAGRSVLIYRPAVRGPGQMPPVGTMAPDADGIALLSQWIDSLPAHPAPTAIKSSKP